MQLISGEILKRNLLRNTGKTETWSECSFSTEFRVFSKKLIRRPFAIMGKPYGSKFFICSGSSSFFVTKTLFMYFLKYFKRINTRIGEFTKYSEAVLLPSFCVMREQRQFVKSIDEFGYIT